jgi:hypothetical protein
MTASRLPGPIRMAAINGRKGHEDAFARPRLSARCRFSQGTFAGTRGNEQDADFATFGPATGDFGGRECGADRFGRWRLGASRMRAISHDFLA